ncbi:MULTISPECIES: hypothetical protein [unclassified Imperialibacter]|uniref:hypothetical protein n=1 Tax=unclassified Imperialibacter TaxID=2629706 RepID=UPI00125503CB|nr:MULTISPECIES: hypothetical protein [unclassified Imperialibacter]CAD5271155.1 conserved membrane hypothetical protein [Imperialibacter sp. 75]CAD5298524.1 conserved membrane hypothetical protein [Imperialibacter sp. 89]VVT35642.1 conserved membrane hypothetical protein [Imperialibacter sp. EC-SDR9]
MKLVATILTTVGSAISIGFGIWHFFVPKIWNWYSYIDKSATELVVAVRAVNVFFSLALVLLGIVNLIFVYREPRDQFSLATMLSVSVVLWGTRSVLQVIYPQGSQNAALQYGMLGTFLFALACFAVSLFILVSQKNMA